MHLWFEVVLTVYGFIFLLIIGGCCESEPELTEEMRNKIYS